jgi:beta-glucosidase
MSGESGTLQAYGHQFGLKGVGKDGTSVLEMPHARPSAPVEKLLAELTLEEQVSLLAGSNMWNTVPILRLDIPKLRVSDGPAGVRGSRFDGPASMNVPCGTALAATWDTSVIREIGELLGREVIAKGARVHLAPTVNLHRTPIGGRNFECMSEDPLLTALIAVEYVKGVQSNGVASCIKHFVGNDTEFERMTIDSQIDERTLREIYLVPFERAVADAEVMSIMTAYNRINGPYAADSVWLLQDVLRDEWNFDGLVMSDWFGLHSTAEGVIAGCDLEMPGPALHRGQKLLDAVAAGEVSAQAVTACARRVLEMLDRTGGLHQPPGVEITRDDADDLTLLRRASSASMVLLKNYNHALPLDASVAMSSVAVIGPNAAHGMVMGGGSAHVTPTRISHPLDALTTSLAARGVDVHHAPGCNINKKLPELDTRLTNDVVVEYFASSTDLDTPGVMAAETGTTGTFHMMWAGDPLNRRMGDIDFAARFTAQFTPDVSGVWKFSVESVAPVKMFLDGALVLDNADVDRGGSFFGMGKPELVQEISLQAGTAYSLLIELRHAPRGMGLSGLNIGAMAPIVTNQRKEAVDVAARCDVSVVIVGTNDDWESEGWDRETLDLPGEQNELVSDVAAVSKRTIVVVNAGSPVAMPWINEVDAVVYAWFPGQEMGDALVDVLTGVVEPSGRLPVTLPRRLEDTPAFEHHPGRNNAAQYVEGRLVGYRWYDTVGKEPLFPFGFGLGYAQIAIDDAATAGHYRVNVTVSNTSSRDGVEVVQVYAHRVSREALPQDEPEQILVGWARVHVPAHSTVNASVVIDRNAYRMWDVDTKGWAQWRGDVELRVGPSSRHVAHRLLITL